MTEYEMKTRDYEAGLPELTGSEKQIAWALDIRKERIDQYWKYIKAIQNLDEILENAESDEQREMFKKNAETAKGRLDRVFSHTESKWWIDTRNEITLKELAKI